MLKLEPLTADEIQELEDSGYLEENEIATTINEFCSEEFIKITVTLGGTEKWIGSRPKDR